MQQYPGPSPLPFQLGTTCGAESVQRSYAKGVLKLMGADLPVAFLGWHLK